jgi:hypothetical protein
MKCKYCDKESKSKNANTQHELRCKSNPNRLDLSYNKFNWKNTVIPATPCRYCQKIYETKSALSNHIRRCPANPDRIIEVMTEDGKNRIRENNKIISKRWDDPINRLNHSIAMKKAVKENPESYSSSNRGRTKQVIVDGIKLQGQWEVDFYLWAKESGLNPQRPTTAFKYVWNGERWYHPDFYIPSKDLYIEVKGYETDRDRAKWNQFPHKLSVIKEREIKQIRNKSFKGL